MAFKKQKNSKKKPLIIFSIASFLNDMGSDMIMPIWPLFVKNVLGAPMSVLGIIDGLGDAVVSISQALAGYLSDRIKKRKVFIWLGYLFAGLSRFGYSLSSKWVYLIPFKIMDRSGKIREAPRDAIIADLSTEKNSGKNFGILNAFDSLGAVFGILISIFFFKYLGYQNLFLLAGIPSLIAVILVISFIKEKKLERIKIHKGIKLKDIDKNFRLFLILSAIFTLGSFSYSFLLIFANKFGFKETSIPVLYLIFTFSSSVSAFLFGKISDKIGKKTVLILSYIFWGLICAVILLAKSAWLIILAFILYGMHKGAKDTMQKAFVSQLAKEEFKASSFGAFQLVVGLCALPGSVIAGFLWDKYGAFATFGFSLTLTIIATVLLLFVRKKT